MADKKISELDPATTPLTGAEEVPLDQLGATRRATVDDIAARAAANGLWEYDGSTLQPDPTNTTPLNHLDIGTVDSFRLHANDLTNTYTLEAGSAPHIAALSVIDDVTPAATSEVVNTVDVAGPTITQETRATDGTNTASQVLDGSAGSVVTTASDGIASSSIQTNTPTSTNMTVTDGTNETDVGNTFPDTYNINSFVIATPSVGAFVQVSAGGLIAHGVVQADTAQTAFNQRSTFFEFVTTPNGGPSVTVAQLSGNGALLTPGALFAEQAAPGTPPPNQAFLYARDNGAGKTQLVVVFNTGAVQVLATQP